MNQDLPKKPLEKIKSEEDLNWLLDDFISATIKDPGRKELINNIRYLSQFIAGRHWPTNIVEESLADESFPEIHLARWGCRMMTAKILAHDFTVWVREKSPISYDFSPEDPLRQMILNQFFNTDKKDSEIISTILNAMLQNLTKKVNLRKHLRTMVHTASWYGVAGICVWYDPVDGVQVDAVHPANIFVDPDAKCLCDCRWIMYRYRSSVDEIEERYGVRVNPYKTGRYASLLAGQSERGEMKNPWATYHGFQEIREFIDPMSEDLKNVWVEYWFLKDSSIETVQYIEEKEVSLPDPVTGEVKQVTIPVVKQRKERKYRGGYRMIIRSAGKILYDGEMPTSYLPFQVFTFFDDPFRIYSMGLGWALKSLNFAIDRSLKYAIDNARRTGQNKIIVRKDALTNPEEGLTNLPGGIMLAETDRELNDVILPLPAMDLPKAHIELIQQIMSIADLTTGLGEISKTQELPREASGRFIDKMIGSQILDLKEVALHVADITVEISKAMLDMLIQNANEDMIVKISGDKDLFVKINPADLRTIDLEDYSFEINEALDYPTSPMDFNTLYMATLQSLMSLPSPIAQEVVKYIKFPDKNALIRALKKKEEMEAQQAQAQQEQAQQQPSEADRAVRQIAVKAASNVGDVYENLSKEAIKESPTSAYDIAKVIPEAVARAYQTVLQNVSGETPPPQGIPPEGVPEVGGQEGQP
jgi:hypothetical protein